MDINLEKENCPICKAKLFTDEVAYCPECGTPHHKKCFLELGHCYYEEKHSEMKQSDVEKIPHPKEKRSSQPEQPVSENTQKTDEKANFFFRSNGIDPDEKIDGAEIKYIAPYVGYNALRYIRKFKSFVATGTKASWNWVAFFFTEYWLISRKMYIPAIIKSFLTALITICTNIIGIDNVYAFAETGDFSLLNDSMFVWLIILEIISVIYQVLFAIFGDYYYKNKVVSDIAELKKNPSLNEMDYMKAGGVNIILPIILYVSIELFVILLVSFL